ncbi:hypothetical protein [Methylosinus sp. H3A]|uniref:hypothetical protein n=1 Tax=Methylosinus sp. H3A TaxID=2785786 RepID=UPI001FEE5092|nr:hypothetical protein [Methylosinus sp. H3A]
MLLRWEQRQLAEASGVPLQTIKGLEVKAGPISAQTRTLNALQDALEAAGVQFIPENGGGVGVRMRERAEREPPKPRKPRTPRKAAAGDEGAPAAPEPPAPAAPAEKPFPVGGARSGKGNDRKG